MGSLGTTLETKAMNSCVYRALQLLIGCSYRDARLNSCMREDAN